MLLAAHIFFLLIGCALVWFFLGLAGVAFIKQRNHAYEFIRYLNVITVMSFIVGVVLLIQGV